MEGCDTCLHYLMGECEDTEEDDSGLKLLRKLFGSQNIKVECSSYTPTVGKIGEYKYDIIVK